MTNLVRAILLPCAALVTLLSSSFHQTSPTDPLLLGSGRMALNCGIAATFNRVDFTLQFGAVRLFQRVLDQRDVGRIFVFDSGDAFQATERVLTNGKRDRVAFLVSGAGGLGSCGLIPNEGALFELGAHTWLAPHDFRGADIERIELQVESYSVQPGSFTRFQLGTLVRVYGRRASKDAPPPR